LGLLEQEMPIASNFLTRLRMIVQSAVAALTLCAFSAIPAAGQESETEAQGPPILFSAPLPEMPGMRMVVVQLTLAPRRDEGTSPGHRTPGSVYVYVTEGTAPSSTPSPIGSETSSRHCRESSRSDPQRFRY